jgi:hypothetical protein
VEQLLAGIPEEAGGSRTLYGAPTNYSQVIHWQCTARYAYMLREHMRERPVHACAYVPIGFSPARRVRCQNTVHSAACPALPCPAPPCLQGVIQTYSRFRDCELEAVGVEFSTSILDNLPGVSEVSNQPPKGCER